jgi:hypothetical protein
MKNETHTDRWRLIFVFHSWMCIHEWFGAAGSPHRLARKRPETCGLFTVWQTADPAQDSAADSV